MSLFCGLYHSKHPAAIGRLSAPLLITGRMALACPAYTSQGGVTAFLHGSLRNGKEIRREMQHSGISAPHTTAGTLLGAYRLWGDDYPMHIEGAVVSVVYDEKNDTLIISRDRMGEMPLLYAVKGDCVVFSDHVDALLSTHAIGREVAATGLKELFGLGPARTPGITPFRDILELKPGQMLIAKGGEISLKRYWQLDHHPHEDDLPVTQEKLFALLDDAVASSMKGKAAYLLSGGIDSTLLVALAKRHTTSRIDTFSVEYEGNSSHFSKNAYQPEEDAPFIDIARDYLGVENRRVILSQDQLFNANAEAMRARGWPGMADIDASLMLLLRAISQSYHRAFSGECADELLGGYPWYQREELINLGTFPWSGSIELRESILNPDIRELLNLPEYVSRRYADSMAAAPRVPTDTPRDGKLRAMQDLCINWFMPNLQERGARMAAQNNITLCTPFCDDRVAQYCINIPWAMKNYRDREKGILRAISEDLLPNELVWRKKSPYPKTFHPEYARMVNAATRDMLSDSSSPLRPLLNAEFISRLMTDKLPQPWYGQLMRGPQMLAYLIQIDRWMREYEVTLVGV